MRLLGLDPGLQRTGWGVVEARANVLRFVAAGVVATDPADDLALRLDALYRGLREVVAQQRPSAAAVEETVVNVNAASSLPRRSSAPWSAPARRRSARWP